MNKGRLEIKIEKIEVNHEYRIQIKEQSHRNEDFFPFHGQFVSLDGFILKSVSLPEVKPKLNIFFTRGTEYIHDDKILTIDYNVYPSYVDLLRMAVYEYNYMGEYGERMIDHNQMMRIPIKRG